MEAEFADDSLDQLETDPRFTGGFAAAVISAFRKRMQMIRSASDERDFYALKALHFEKLKGKRSHQFSMRLNDQWRLILEFKGKSPSKKVVIVTIEDYH
ncbi:MAG: type II toxin-antitoxin system RelE/ParE family toxin [Sterolibacterium sp.]|nr:type II toxin-antitoxin system RelE/ParE family toxin [Sterolibacterium sp.]